MKDFVFKGLVFLAIFVSLQAVIGYGTMPEQIKEVKKFLNAGTDVLYFGDSVIDFWSEDETDKSSIISMVQKLERGYTLEGIHHAAYNMDIYYSFAKYISGSRHQPKALVIPINLATFSGEWMKPHFQFDLERSILENNNVLYDIFYRPVCIFKKESITNAEYMNAGVYNGEKLIGRIKDFDNSSFSVFSDENFSKKIVFRYMYKLNAEQKKVQSLQKMLDLYKGGRIKLIFYITPVDYQACVKKLGPDFMKQVDYNRNFLKTMITSGGASCIDMTFSLPGGFFGWNRHSVYINEHMNTKGRQFTAEKIDREIRKILKIPDRV